MDGLAKTKIMVVEDEQSLFKAINEKLSNFGYEVMVCENGAEGLNKIEEFRPDVVLLDIIMPEKSGIQFLEELKSKNVLRPKIIVLTNLELEEVVAKSSEYGVDKYLMKSNTSLDKLITEINEIIGN